MNKFTIITIFLLVQIINVSGQEIVKRDTTKIALSGYVETYIGFDLGNNKENNRPVYIYNHKRNREVNLNLGILKANVQRGRLRSNIAFMLGNYTQYNLAHEPSWIQYTYEANIGYQLDKNGLWNIDMGILPSHIGFESAIGIDCQTLTRSLVAENSPYYESGIKLSGASKNQKFTFGFLLLNGWQSVAKPLGLNSLSTGGQLTYKPSSKLTLNYSNFIGHVSDGNKGSFSRIYHNFYAQFLPTNKTNFTLGYDAGVDNEERNWYTIVGIFQQKFKGKNAIALRGEYFDDPEFTILGTAINTTLFSWSIGYDRQITDQALWRVEYKNIQESFSNISDSKSYLTTAVAVKF
jgi:hypothetical protein